MSLEKAASSKKRKRDANPEVHFEVSTSMSGTIGPLLVSFSALQASTSTPFNCYSRKRSKTSAKANEENDGAEVDMIVVGETASVEFVSNEDETRKVAESGCRYVLAVRSKKTGSISLLPSAQTPQILSHTVKALKSIPSSAAPSKVQYLEAKTALGETFGTKKQKANIRAQERNKIDVSAMEGVMGYVMDSIEKGAEGLMTAEESKEAADKNRLIPPFSATATDPADVYPLHDIIPEAEWKALSINAFDAAETHKDRVALLSYQRSDWIRGHLHAHSDPESRNRKKNLKIIMYIAAMMAFREAGERKSLVKEKLYEKLSTVPSVIVDSLLNRFAEVPRGSSSYQFTSAAKTSLLTHIFALCLRLDNYAADCSTIAHDFSMKTTDVHQLFKSLGCKISKLSDKERARLGLSDKTADLKRAVLHAPVEFPKAKRTKR